MELIGVVLILIFGALLWCFNKLCEIAGILYTIAKNQKTIFESEEK